MVLLEKPLCLAIGSKRFKLFQPTIGKLILLRPLLRDVVSGDEAIDNVVLQALLKVSEKRRAVCEIIAIHSFKESKDILDPYRLEARANEFAALEDADIALLFLQTLTFPNADKIIGSSGLDKELERRRRLMEAKDTKGCAVVGGMTLYGGLIGHAMERYGWSLQYALWGISAANLQLLAADEPTSVYLSPEERKKVPSADMAGRDIIDASDPKNAALVRELLTNKNRRR